MLLLKSITDTFKRQLPKSCDREGQVLKPSCKLINPGNNVGPAYLLSSTHRLFRQRTKPQQNTKQCLGEKRSLGIFYDPAQMSFLLPIYKYCQFLSFYQHILGFHCLLLRNLNHNLKVKPLSFDLRPICISFPETNRWKWR